MFDQIKIIKMHDEKNSLLVHVVSIKISQIFKLQIIMHVLDIKHTIMYYTSLP